MVRIAARGAVECALFLSFVLHLCPHWVVWDRFRQSHAACCSNFAGWSRLCAEVIPLIEDVANELELDVIDVHAVLSEGGVQRSKKEWYVCRIA
jgi:hypothetical protein